MRWQINCWTRLHQPFDRLQRLQLHLRPRRYAIRPSAQQLRLGICRIARQKNGYITAIHNYRNMMRCMPGRRYNHYVAGSRQRLASSERPEPALLKFNRLRTEPLRPMLCQVTHRLTKPACSALEFSARGQEPRGKRKVRQAIDMIGM